MGGRDADRGVARRRAALAQQAQQPFDGAEREAIEGIIADYILDNPEIIYRAIQVLQERQQAAQAEATRLAPRDQSRGARARPELAGRRQPRGRRDRRRVLRLPLPVLQAGGGPTSNA